MIYTIVLRVKNLEQETCFAVRTLDEGPLDEDKPRRHSGRNIELRKLLDNRFDFGVNLVVHKLSLESLNDPLVLVFQERGWLDS